MSRGRPRSAAARFTRCALAALVFVGFPANGLVEGATPGAPSASSAILSVESDPPGAAVFVDGEALGTTPIAVRTLAAGDHRVRVAMAGYLDNSRVVRVNGGQAESVRVKLTRNEASPQVDPQPPKKTSEKKGSGKKWAFIGLGVAAVGAAAYVVATKNSPPVAGNVGVSPAGTGLMGVTSFTFTSQGASDPDGDPLTYSWTFGDGGTASGQTASHVFNSAGSFSVSLTVSDGKKSATAGVTLPVRDVNGSWVSNLQGVTRIWVLSQSGNRVSGSYVSTGAPGAGGSVTATLSSPRTFNGTASLVGFIPFRFDGQFNDTMTVLSGVANDSGFVNASLTFTRQ